MNIFPRWFCRILSYLSAFMYGAYVYGVLHGNTPELYRWVLTGFFGLTFYGMSLPDKKSIV